MPRGRSFAVVAAIGVAVTGMAYSLWWAPVVRHLDQWTVPDDIWTTLRAGLYVGLGDLGGVYAGGTGLVTLPAMAVVLAPLAVLVDKTGLSQSYPYSLAHPTAWLLVGPVTMLSSVTALLALDALAAALHVAAARRRVLCLAEAAALWPVVVVWGHPEDMVAVAAAVAGTVAVMQQRPRRAGWWLGAGVAFQPLVLVMVPLVVGQIRGWQGRALATGQVLVPPALVAGVPLWSAPGPTVRALVHQPNYPALNRPTPWVGWAKVLSPGRRVAVRGARLVTVHGLRSYDEVVRHEIVPKAVAAGPERLAVVVLATGIGLALAGRELGPSRLAWCCALVLSLRLLAEPVLDPYYVWPPLAVALVVAAAGSRWSFATAWVAASAATVYAESHFGPWAWWLPVVAFVAAAVVAGLPRPLLHAPRASQSRTATRARR